MVSIPPIYNLVRYETQALLRAFLLNLGDSDARFLGAPFRRRVRFILIIFTRVSWLLTNQFTRCPGVSSYRITDLLFLRVTTNSISDLHEALRLAMNTQKTAGW